MQAYIRYFKNNDINYWAETKLNPSELSQFRAAQTANSQLWMSYQEQGLYTSRDIYETIHSAILDADISVVSGQEIIMSTGVVFESLKLHPEYVNWLDRYNQETGGDTLMPLVQ
jgi:hypothetical protein